MVYRQAFKTAGEEFTVFDQATTDILVGWGDGEKLICEFASEKALNNLSYRRELLKRSKLYSVSVYDYEIKKLTEEHALSTVCGGSVSVLDSSFYDEHTGVVTEKILKFQEI